MTSGFSAVLLTAAFAGPNASAAQTWAGVVSAETVCRLSPSPSADAVGMLESGSLILFDVAVGAATGSWWQVVPSQSGRYGPSHRCWVPSSNVARTRETEHLLRLADRLLSASVRPALDELLAVHNLFVHYTNREQVEASAALTQRRTALLAKAVEVAQMPRFLDGPRPVDDPLVLAWIESLGEQVRYSEDRSGQGSWTFVGEAPGAGEEPSRPQPVESTPAREGELAIIAHDVACRYRPSWIDYDYSTVLPLDFHFRTERADTVVAGEAWVHVGLWGCWVLAAHTAPGGTEEHVLTIADGLLTSAEGWSSENRLRVYNVLSSWNRGHRRDAESSPVLGLKRLDLLRVAIVGHNPRSASVRMRAWVTSLGDELTLAYEGSGWAVSDEAYLALYDKYRSDAFADEILWRYASESAWDCEGEFACSVEQGVNRRLARYWTVFPGGRHIAEAIEGARTILGYGLESCNAARPPGTNLMEAGRWGWSGWKPAGEKITRELLATLEEVNEEEKAPVLETLAKLEACAAAVG